jgi:Tol biopolymer transport system component
MKILLLHLMLASTIWFVLSSSQTMLATGESGDGPQGLIAYLGEDDNLYVIDSAGGNPEPLTFDAYRAPPGVDKLDVLYSGPTWSPDGRYILARRVVGGPAYVKEASLILFDSKDRTQRELPLSDVAPQIQGLDWLSRDEIVFGHNSNTVQCDSSNYCAYTRQFEFTSFNVLTSEENSIYRFPPGTYPLFGLAVSPDERAIAYQINNRDDPGRGGPLCALDIAKQKQQCTSREPYFWSWSPDSDRLVFSDCSGERYCTGGDLKVFASSTQNEETIEGGEPHFTFESPLWSPDASIIIYQFLGDMSITGASMQALDVTSGQTVQLDDDGLPQSFSPDGRFLVYQKEGGEGHQLWATAVDGSDKRLIVQGGPLLRGGAWQPREPLPVLFIHGCGGSLSTWTDPGWIAGATEIGDFTAGDASGKLYRAVIPGQPAVPAYALDYHDSQGSIFDLAALIPQAIDKIKEETGAEKVMLATHSMGGVLAEAYVGGLASGQGYDSDVQAAFMVAPPSRGSFLINWLTGNVGNALACPQASELGPNSKSIVRLESTDLPDLDYTVVSGTRFWIPFVGLNDGVIADGDVGLNGAQFEKRQVHGTHIDTPLLPNTVAALCASVVNDPCVPELNMDQVKELFRERYKEDMFK